MPVEDEILHVSINGPEISFLSSFDIIPGMLLGSSDLFGLSEDIMFRICNYDLWSGSNKEIREMFV